MATASSTVCKVHIDPPPPIPVWPVQATAEDATPMVNAFTAGTGSTSTSLLSPVSHVQLSPIASTVSQVQASALHAMQDLV